MKAQGTPFAGRARAGKNAYGMTDKKIAQLAAAGRDTRTRVHAHAQSLLQFTQQFTKHARDLAKSGQKDEARNWFRFFNNSQICHVLESFSNIEKHSLNGLKSELKALGEECHPLDQASWTTDIAAIRFCLQEILSRTQLGARGPVACRHGQRQRGQKDFERTSA